MTAGQLLAYAGMKAGKEVAWIPSYGPEMRGGAAYCTVVISDNPIGSPIVSKPRAACVFNRPSFDKFSPQVQSGGLLIVNSSLINVSTDRDDIVEYLIPANDMAAKSGNAKATNLAILGAFIGASGVLALEVVHETVTEKLGRKKELLNANLQILEAGYAFTHKSPQKATRL